MTGARLAGRRRGSHHRNGCCRHRMTGARLAGRHRGSHHRNGHRPDRRNDDPRGRRRCRRHGPGPGPGTRRRGAGRRHGGRRRCRGSRHRADRHHRGGGRDGRCQRSSRDGERRTQMTAHRLAGSRRAQRNGIHRRRRDRGRCRSAARHPCRHPCRRRGRHRLGTNRTAGQTAPGCSRHDCPHRGCLRRGSSRLDRIRRRSHGSSWGADHRQRRPGRAKARHIHRRNHRGYRSSRHASHRGPRRTRHGHRLSREIRQSPYRHWWSRRGSNSRRSSHQIDRSHPSPPGVPNRHGPRHRSGVRRLGVHARHRRRRAPARCRPQPLKPPPEHISLHPTRSNDPHRPASHPPFLAVIRLPGKPEMILEEKHVINVQFLHQEKSFQDH
jgi:hypothetical protein